MPSARVLLAAVVIAASLSAGAAPDAAPALPPAATDAAALIIGGALSGNGAYAHLAELTDTVGARLSGSAGAAAGVQWALRRFELDGLSAHLEKVMTNHWERGAESGEILASSTAARAPLAITALGGSIGTAPEGLTAEVIEARSFDEVRALGDRARGRVILYQHAMSTAAGYGEGAGLRFAGASEAAKVGAVGMLIRSLATASLRSPHTGAMKYADGAPKIPAAAISTEDADTLHRLIQRGPTRVHLSLGCRQLAPVESANVIGEVRGREHPEEIVVLGAHLDSWDLAQGAVDDGAGVAIMMEAARLIGRLPKHPRRTVRVVLFMNEENGTDGARTYAADHAAEAGKHVAALEADAGAGRPESVMLKAGDGGLALLAPWMAPLSALGISSLGGTGHGGTDIEPLETALVPIAGVHQDSTHYFDWHHSAADTLDKVNPHELAEAAAAFGWIAYALAEMERPVPRIPAAEASAGGH